jgi:hypothetical protein
MGPSDRKSVTKRRDGSRTPQLFLKINTKCIVLPRKIFYFEDFAG